LTLPCSTQVKEANNNIADLGHTIVLHILQGSYQLPIFTSSTTICMFITIQITLGIVILMVSILMA
jgi:hypothetical protein